ncbi:MAG: alanine dehydrogenase [Proteobacteria bacterium]|nr:alanine dehydrogenase [Pseudomonadota bacterium]MBU1742517.1 alanine dehydrogenase [Pseudomonadota bacterium]
MIIGVPKEIKTAERRVALTPAGARSLTAASHTVFVETTAGEGSGFEDDLYLAAGAEIRPEADQVWNEAEMILKVKEPIAPEFDRMRPGLILFTYLHLAAAADLTARLLAARVVGLAYETFQRSDGSLPLLAPMSAVAGRLSLQAGAYALETNNGGRGVLLSGVPGVRPAKVVILGAGVAGLNACLVAVGIGARVCVLDINQDRLEALSHLTSGRAVTLMSNEVNVEEEVSRADLVIGSVLIPGARAPKLVSREMVGGMKPGAAIVDISIDQGGCCETSCATNHFEPTYVEQGVVHYCVTNMPGVVPRTSTLALTNATLPYVMEVADKGCHRAIEDNPEIASGLNVLEGEVAHEAVARSLGLPWRTPN